jgi:hypothetical protein
MQQKRNAYMLLIETPGGRKQLGRPRCEWILGCILGRNDGMVWIGLVWLRIGTSWRALLSFEVIKLPVSLNNAKISDGFTTAGLSSSARLHGVS